KACDLCYRKRIKCDAQKPRCSNCRVYSTDCTHEAVSRQKRKREKASATSRSRGQQHQQGRKQQAAQINDELDNSSVIMPSPSPSLLYSNSHGRRLMELPSEDIVRHVIDVYLATFNTVLPLFSPTSLNRVVDNWYSKPTADNEHSCWATINVVLALAQCHSHGQLSPAVAEAVNVTKCLENAQSVLAEIVAGNMDLQSVQILLGLGFLFMGATPGDVRAPIIFISTGIRLAQAMGMHRRDSCNNTKPDEDMQRRRVFWIAYILDRDVAARTRQAPIQHDADMDLDLPPIKDEVTMLVIEDGADAGADDDFTYTNAGASPRAMAGLNLFRARIELAQIQGRVYDCVFSVRARYMHPGEKARLAQGIRLSIQQWKARLPASLGVEFLSNQTDSDGSMASSILPAVICYMHSLTTMCLGQLCGVSSMEFHWIEKVISYARGLGNYETTLPFGWNVLVSQCREFMRLFLSIRTKHPNFVNVQLCPFTSGLLCLSVNSFLNFEDGNSKADQRLMAEAATMLGEVMGQTQSEIVSKVLEVHMELSWHSMLITTELAT
ncbi:hypothetical protein LX36DRAFT_728912, partial [Colletotrichum falcatum]